MKKNKLTDSFIEGLYKHVPHRPELVREISRILKIEKEPASRRLSGNVNFSIDEMGILAKEFDISIDSLLHANEDHLKTPIILEFPWSKNSIDSLLDSMLDNIIMVNKICVKPYELGSVFNSLPIDIYMHFPNLTKFMLFKWGHFFVDPDEFSNYSSWKVPEKFQEVKKQIEIFNHNSGKRVYIWDVSLIWALVKEIKYLYEIDILNPEDLELIKNDLHSLLTGFETYIKSLNEIRYQNIEAYFYMSNIPIGVTGLYVMSELGQLAFSSTYFSRTGFSTDIQSNKSIQQWMFSLRKISTLMSSSGYKERRVFFKEQHLIVDSFL
ncbi:hypothetical protein D0T49_08330 [Paludibacter sp. 221]|uniref:helix-turn-helix domain-containing protein n=1 Tax=Paludibacter sp. 221 TaxID=2302939 RepID=UPI0013D66E9D|nr:helix-turn-helix domain-containing protein [Paludibacter sp. 221]NDV47051.1 hypothetical protein [Paludibacter sp. 221]